MRPQPFLALAAATAVAFPAAHATAAPAINRVHVANPSSDTPSASQNVSVTPTATSTPGPLEATEDVHLRGGVCTPVFTTYPNGTPIPTIAGAVSPPGMLQVLWDFESGTWMGYSPLFPEVGDLTEVNFLDVVFLCVGGSGPNAATFTRPLVWAWPGQHDSRANMAALTETDVTAAGRGSAGSAPRRAHPRASPGRPTKAFRCA